MTLTAHPYADKFPMLPEAELAELAESIAANGLRNPIVLTTDGLILDGRNRAAACVMLGIEPETVVYEGDDLAEYVIDCNVTRRNMSTGARAMATALVLAEDGRRNNGRWKRGSVDIGESPNSSTWQDALKRAGVILDFAPELAADVVAGDLTLNAAYQKADEIRRSEEAEELAEKARKKQEAERARIEAEREAQYLTELTEAASKYVELVESGQMTAKAAWAAHQADTEKERLAERELDMGRRDTCTRIAECVRFLDGGQAYAEVFLRDFHPHEHRFLAEQMRLNRARIDSAIDFLATIREGIPA